jgi:hypothetical protein
MIEMVKIDETKEAEKSAGSQLVNTDDDFNDDDEDNEEETDKNLLSKAQKLLGASVVNLWKNVILR